MPGGRTHTDTAPRSALVAALVAVVCVALAVVPSAGASEITDFQGTWVDRALAGQYELGADVPLLNAPWVGTHNSFNSAAEMGPTLSDQDSNQKIKLTDQLAIDIRSLELDLHRFPSAQGGGYSPVVCHALEGGRGCTIEKTLGPVLDEISGWLRDPAHSDQVLLLYLEDDLEDTEMHNEAAATLEAKLGDLIYHPPQDAGCTELPYEISRDDIRAAGKQVIIVGNCGVGSAWTNVVHSWNEHSEERPFSYEDFPSCGPTFTLADYQSTFIRYYEDSTQLTAVAGDPDDGISPATAAAFARCGVDLIGLDQLTPFDGRLHALVWSWAVGQPAAGHECAVMRVGSKRSHGRWIARECNAVHRRPACLADTGQWQLPGRNTTFDNAKRACRKLGAELSVPRTGNENQLLRLAMARHSIKSAWLGYRLRGGEWTPLDSRRPPTPLG